MSVTQKNVGMACNPGEASFLSHPRRGTKRPPQQRLHYQDGSQSAVGRGMVAHRSDEGTTTRTGHSSLYMYMIVIAWIVFPSPMSSPGNPNIAATPCVSWWSNVVGVKRRVGGGGSVFGWDSPMMHLPHCKNNKAANNRGRFGVRTRQGGMDGKTGLRQALRGTEETPLGVVEAKMRMCGGFWFC